MIFQRRRVAFSAVAITPEQQAALRHGLNTHRPARGNTTDRRRRSHVEMMW